MRQRPAEIIADLPSAAPQKVAIIGGGFSGTILLAHLAERLAAGSSVTVFDARGAHGSGTAYGTRERHHLLNVPADRMGAFEPDHFIRWLSGQGGRAAVARICPDRAGAKDYLPRALYGAYLGSILDQALATAVRRGVTATLVPADIEDVRTRGKSLAIKIGNRRELYDVLVLATGNQPPRRPAFAARSLLKAKDYIADVWANGLPEHLRKDATVLILGTGLTAVDAVLSLEARGHEGRIIAVSRHGWLPAMHAAERPSPWTWVVPPERVAPRAVAYLHWLKTEAKAAQAAGADWRGVFEALRPLTSRLWRDLDERQQQKVLRQHALWSIHRHRMAPEIAARLERLRESRQLEIVAARILSATSRFGTLRVRWRRRHAKADEVLKPSLILNCTGPDYDVEHAESSLYRRLIARGIVVRSPNGLGLGIDPDGSVRSLTGHMVFALGALAVGDQFEITAVPELRAAARNVAERIVERAQEIRHPSIIRALHG
jgi:Uncharacterized protein conserved in bacteria